MTLCDMIWAALDVLQIWRPRSYTEDRGEMPSKLRRHSQSRLAWAS